MSTPTMTPRIASSPQRQKIFPTTSPKKTCSNSARKSPTAKTTGNGRYSGSCAILAFFGELLARSGGTIKIALHDVIGGDEHTIGLHHEFAESGSNRVDQNAANIFRVRDGRVSEVWERPPV